MASVLPAIGGLQH